MFRRWPGVRETGHPAGRRTAVRRTDQGAAHPQQLEAAIPQVRKARPVPPEPRVERAESGRPAHRRRRVRAGQQPAARRREAAQRRALGPQPGALRDLTGAQVHRGPGEQGDVAAGHGLAPAASPSARTSARMPSANDRGA